MGQGLQVFGPNGEIWLDTYEKTMRLIGVLSLPSTVSQTYLDFSIASGETPWAHVVSAGKGYGNYEFSYPSSGVCRMTYYTSDYNSSNGQVNIFYGVG